MRWPPWLSLLGLYQRSRAALLVNRAFVKIIDGGLTSQVVEQPPPGRCRFRHWLDTKYCGRELLDGHDMCFFHAPDPEKYRVAAVERYFGESMTLIRALEKEIAEGRSLWGAWLRDAPLHGNFLNQTGANFSKADLRFADLSGAHLSYGSLNSAQLAMADLEKAYLSDVDLRNAVFTGANLHEVKFRNADFTGVRGLTRDSFRGWKWGFLPIYHILETYPDQCERVYQALTTYFSGIGALDDESWASYRMHVIHRKLLFKRLSPSVLLSEEMVENFVRPSAADRPRRTTFRVLCTWVHNVQELALSYFSALAWGYGEKPLRVLGISAFIIFLFALWYDFCGALSESGFQGALYFSIVTFTTLGYGDVLPVKQYRLVAASEAVCGLLLAGMFLFCLSRRVVGRR